MKILSIFLIIFLLNVVQSGIIPPLIENLFNTLKRTVIKKAIFDKTSQLLGYRNIGHAATVMKGRVHQVEKLIALSESFKSEVEVLSNRYSQNTEDLMKVLTTQITNTERFLKAFRNIEEYVLEIESKFKFMMKLRIARSNQTETLVKFADAVVDTSGNTVYDAIIKLNEVLSGTEVIHHKISHDTFKAIVEYLESKNDITECETIVATMETLHTFVQSMILVFIKGKVVVKYGYNIKDLEKRGFNVSDEMNENHHYKREIEDLENLVVQSVERLLLNFMRSTKHPKPYTYNCRPSKGYLEHHSYERFINFLSNYFAEERYLRHPYIRKTLEFFRCYQDCPHFDLSSKSDPFIKYCNGLLRNCKKFVESPKICRISKSAQLFSKDTQSCPVNNTIETKPKMTPDFFMCDTCICTCDTQIGYNYIYTAPVLATPGHVLTGIRLSKSQNTIHLSILSGKPLPMGFVDIQKSEWTELPTDEEPERNRNKYFRISWWCRTFVLADVKLERYHVVTGVQFVINPKRCMINLKVYGTMINVLYGIMIPNATTSALVKPCE